MIIVNYSEKSPVCRGGGGDGEYRGCTFNPLRNYVYDRSVLNDKGVVVSWD